MKRQRRPSAERHREADFGVYRGAQQLEHDVGRDRPARRENHALEALLPHQPPPRRAERAAHRDLAQPCRPSSEHEVAEVRAGDHQHQPDERDERHPEPAHGRVLVRDLGHRLCPPWPIRGGGALPRVPRWKRLVEARGDRPHLRRRRGDRHC